MRADIGHHARDVVNSIPSFHGQSVGDLQLIRQCHFNYSAVKLLDNRLLDLVDTEIFAMILAVMPMSFFGDSWETYGSVYYIIVRGPGHPNINSIS